jgi:hypothetical protein
MPSLRKLFTHKKDDANQQMSFIELPRNDSIFSRMLEYSQDLVLDMRSEGLVGIDLIGDRDI